METTVSFELEAPDDIEIHRRFASLIEESINAGASAFGGLPGTHMMWSWPMTTEIRMKTKTKRLRNIHPGEVLSEEFLRPLKWTQYKLVKQLGVPLTQSLIFVAELAP